MAGRHTVHMRGARRCSHRRGRARPAPLLKVHTHVRHAWGWPARGQARGMHRCRRARPCGGRARPMGWARVEARAAARAPVPWAALDDPGPAAAEAVGDNPGGGAPRGERRRGQQRRRRAAAAERGARGERGAGGAVPRLHLHAVHLRAVGAGGSGHSAWSERVRVAVPAAAAPAAAAGDGSSCTDLAVGGAADDAGPGGCCGARAAWALALGCAAPLRATASCCADGFDCCPAAGVLR